MIGHILREDRNNIINFAMTWAPEGKPLPFPSLPFPSLSAKKRKALNNMATHSRKGEELNRVEIMGRGENGCG